MLSGPASSWERPGSAPADVAGRPAPTDREQVPIPMPFAFRPEGWLPDAPGYVEPPAIRPVPSMAVPALQRVRTRDVREIRAAIVCLAQRTDLEPLNRHIAATGVAANAPAGGVPVWATDVRSANV